MFNEYMHGANFQFTLLSFVSGPEFA